MEFQYYEVGKVLMFIIRFNSGYSNICISIVYKIKTTKNLYAHKDALGEVISTLGRSLIVKIYPYKKYFI